MTASAKATAEGPRWGQTIRLRVVNDLTVRPRLRARAVQREKLVVVGNGMVGQRFCERLVEGGGASRYEITVIGEERVPAYDRVHLTDIWRGRDPADLVLRNVQWYEDHGIELRLRERVKGLDRSARRVTTESGYGVSYDKLVFATGSRATTPNIAVEGGASLLLYRTLEDAERILESVRARSPGEQRVAVVGGGLLGLEAARMIQLLGYEVMVLEGSSQLLPRQLDAEAAAALEHTIVASGIDLMLRARILRVVKTEGGFRIALADADPVDARVVVVAAGARACDELAREAGLTCHVRGGIEVNRALRTRDPNIFAIGECAAHEHVPHGLVAPGYAMADVLADNLMGRRRRLDPQSAATRLKLDLTEVNVLGNPLQEGAGRDLIWRKPGQYRRLVVDGSRVVSAIGVGEWPDMAVLQQYVSARRRVERSRFNRFLESGSLGLADDAPTVTQWPDSAIVCQCAGVSCGVLRTAISAGANTPEALARSTKASTLCGTCGPLVATLCGAPAEAPAADRGRGLAVAAMLAVVFGGVTLVAPKIPIAQSIRLQSIDIAWFDSFWKQVTGFSILGLIVLGLTLSLRKRVSRFRLGSYSGWRLLHGALGALGVLALFAHTGFRMGANLNMALMIAFLVSAITGAAAGMLTVASASRNNNQRVQGVATATRLVHDYVFWPLSVLLVFHVVKVYYF